MAKHKSKRKGWRSLPLVGRSMCRQLGCDFECDDPSCEVCPKCGSHCRAIFAPPGVPKEQREEVFAAWRRGDIAPWPELLLAQHAEASAPGELQ